MTSQFTIRRAKKGFVERSITGLNEALDRAALADEVARRNGWLQTLDPRTKIIGFGGLMIAAVGLRHLALVLVFLLLAVGLAATSRIPLRVLVSHVWVGVLALTGLIALPSVFLTPGKMLVTLPWLGWPVTLPGLRTAALLIVRAETTATLALTLVLSTPWTHVLKALRVLRMPGVAVITLGMTHRYIFLLLHLAGDFFVARRSRIVGTLNAAQQRQIAASTAGVLLDKSVQMSGEVYQAMLSRGFRGEIHTLDDFCWRARDTVALLAFCVVVTLALWFDL